MNISKYRKLNIPASCIPNESHNPQTVYRATISENVLCIDDFLPSIIDKELRGIRKAGPNLEKLKKSIGSSKIDCGKYSCSVYDDFNEMITDLIKKNVLKHKNTISRGVINNSKGIASQPSKSHHMNYYIYNYIENNPYVDFEIIKKVEDYLK
ncbi:MAG: hypothetical protein ACOCV1_06195 [Bacillota bacterium]